MPWRLLLTIGRTVRLRTRRGAGGGAGPRAGAGQRELHVVDGDGAWLQGAPGHRLGYRQLVTPPRRAR